MKLVRFPVVLVLGMVGLVSIGCVIREGRPADSTPTATPAPAPPPPAPAPAATATATATTTATAAPTTTAAPPSKVMTKPKAPITDAGTD